MLAQTEPPHEILQALIARLAAATELTPEAVARQLRPPPQPEQGDWAFPCFELAKQRKVSPPALAQELAGKLMQDPEASKVLLRVEAAGPFLNLQAHPGLLVAAILNPLVASKSKRPAAGEGRGPNIVVEFSSPNIAKPFHVGHLMTTVLGATLVRIFRALGCNVIGVNHLGDWGTQCGYQFLAWQRADSREREEQLAARGLDYLVDLYVEVNAPAKRLAQLENQLLDRNIATQPEERSKIEAETSARKLEAAAIDQEARALFKKLEDGDAELRALWERMRRTTLEVLKPTYDRLGVSFDSDAGEGFYEPFLKPLIEELKAKGVLVTSEGAWVIPLDQPGVKRKRPPFIVVKSDGATKYETRDLAAAIYRKKTYDFAKNLYVVNVQQSEHFSGLFLALKKSGYAWAKDCQHVSFGIMQLKEGDEVLPMSTRAGRMIPLEELLDRMVGVVRSIVAEKNPDLAPEKKERVAEAVGVGAIVFWVQSRRRQSNIVFDWKLATSPEGDTGPYVQYTHARACSILRKAGSAEPGRANLQLLEAPEEVAVARALDRFPAELRAAAEHYEPSLVATWLLETARAFNDFYNKCAVLKAEPALRAARLVLVEAVRRRLAHGLELLGVAAPEEM